MACIVRQRRFAVVVWGIARADESDPTARNHGTQPWHRSPIIMTLVRSAPRAIVLTVLSSGVVGWAYLLATTFSITSPDTLLSPDNATGGTNVFAQVLYDASMARFGDARAAVALLAIILPAQFFCGASCMTDGGRAIFAFARDGAMPFPRLLAWVHPRTRVPIVAVGVMALGTLVIASPMLGSLQAFTAVTSIATIGESNRRMRAWMC